LFLQMVHILLPSSFEQETHFNDVYFCYSAYYFSNSFILIAPFPSF
jgi:hypothetical protein